jgi:hypothetical protein
VEKIRMSEVKNLVEYEKVRDSERAGIIALKQNRRVSVGEQLTLLFENRATVLFQIHEMVRTERIVIDARIQEELDVYNALIPEPGELSATLFIEIPELIHMSQEQVREAVNQFQGLEHDHVWLDLGQGLRVAARFEPGHSKEEKMAAVHYVRFPLSPAARDALADPARRARIVVDHPRYHAERELPRGVRAQLLQDLAG